MKVVKVLARGYETLKEMGVTVQARQGKGGIESQFWQLAIARWLVRTQPGIKPVIEDARLGKPMDVAVEQDGILRAFEVSLSPSWATQNAVKDLAAGADEVVVCAVSDEELREIRERLERELEPGGEWTRIQHRVSFRLLRSFLV